MGRVCLPSQRTWIIVGMGDNKNLQRFLVPLVRLICYVKALFPHATIRVVKLEEGVHIQHLKWNQKYAKAL